MTTSYWGATGGKDDRVAKVWGEELIARDQEPDPLSRMHYLPQLHKHPLLYTHTHKHARIHTPPPPTPPSTHPCSLTLSQAILIEFILTNQPKKWVMLSMWPQAVPRPIWYCLTWQGLRVHSGSALTMWKLPHSFYRCLSLSLSLSLKRSTSWQRNKREFMETHVKVISSGCASKRPVCVTWGPTESSWASASRRLLQDRERRKRERKG